MRSGSVLVGCCGALLLAGCPRRAPPPSPPPPSPAPATAATEPAPAPTSGVPEGMVECASCGGHVEKEKAIVYFGTVCSEDCRKQWDERRKEAWPACEHCGSKDWRATGLKVIRHGTGGGYTDVMKCGNCDKGEWGG